MPDLLSSRIEIAPWGMTISGLGLVGALLAKQRRCGTTKRTHHETVAAECMVACPLGPARQKAGSGHLQICAGGSTDIGTDSVAPVRHGVGRANRKELARRPALPSGDRRWPNSAQRAGKRWRVGSKYAATPRLLKLLPRGWQTVGIPHAIFS